jgi:hypothetical protein
VGGHERRTLGDATGAANVGALVVTVEDGRIELVFQGAFRAEAIPRRKAVL